MKDELKAYLNEVLHLSEAMRLGEYGDFKGDEQIKFIETIQRAAKTLDAQNLRSMSLIGLATQSHDLRQSLTTLVGYSALLKSPKLSDHENMTEEQLDSVERLHDACRYLHWYLDSLIMFADQFVHPRLTKSGDAGMLDLAGYIRAQTEHYVCRRHLSEIIISNNLPLVYANDFFTKMMLRGLFTVALDICNKANIQLIAYTVMKVVRIKLTIVDCADELPDLLKFMQIETVPAEDDRLTQAFSVPTTRLKHPTLVELGMLVATRSAREQNGRLKVNADRRNLVFTLTMPTVPAVNEEKGARLS